MLHYAHKHFLILHAHKRTAENEKRKKLDNVKVWGQLTGVGTRLGAGQRGTSRPEGCQRGASALTAD